jgi:hypothetical protein
MTSIKDQVYIQVLGQVYNHVNSQVHNQVYNHVENKVRSQIYEIEDRFVLEIYMQLREDLLYHG